MAFGFSPKHVRNYDLQTFENGVFLVLAIEATYKLGWDVSNVSETGFVAYTKFSWSSWSEEVTVKIDGELAILKSECTGNQLFDWSKNKKNIDELIITIDKLVKVLTQEELETKLADIRQNLVSNEDDSLSQPLSTSKNKITNFFSFFIPTDGYFISPILVNLNVLVFIAMIISGVHILFPENQDLLNWGANFRPITTDGQSWRLFTACFLHIGIIHLLLNMYALVYIGLLLEPFIGKTRFLAAYLISGIVASATSLWWHELTISAGASGAIFGMYGVFLALLTTNLLDKSVKKAFLTSIIFFVAYSIINGIKPNSGIDNAAHVGGLISGLIIGYSLIPSLRQKEDDLIKFYSITGLLVVMLIFSISIFKILPANYNSYEEIPPSIREKYEKKIKEFVAMESMALEVFKLTESSTDEMILKEIKDRGLYYWNENLIVIKSMDELNLPETLNKRNRKLKAYCELRIESYNLLYKAIEEKTNKYENELLAINKQIEAIITEISAEQ